MTYTKTISGRQVFSDCRTIQMPDGTWVSNPSQAQIEQAGWSVYVPPTPPQTEPDYEAVLQAVKKMLSQDIAELSDEDALDIAALYPTFVSKIGEQVNAGERLWYDGKLYKVVQSHTIQEDWTPDILPALYTEVSIVEIPEWVQPTGAQDAYNKGDKVTFKGEHYVCQIDGCTWSPEEYPAAWNKE